jgi:choline dehydrogenase-like flavoprotein
MSDLPDTVDVAIIGSGIGGSTIAYGLAGSGARIAILERGFHLGAHPAARDARAIFQRGVFRPVETWLDPHGHRFNPGNYYYVGGNSKFYGAVLIRYRERDFAALEHWDGVSPAWPFGYEVLEPWYGRAEQLFEVRGVFGQDPTEPPHSTSYTSTPVCRMNRPSQRIALDLCR